VKPGLAISLAGLERDSAAPWSEGPRAAIEWSAATGFRAVQLDATAPGIRPRELDRSARRDLAALLRRLQLRLAGLDLWIPTEHFAEPARAERALDAVLSAIDLAAELSRLVEASAGPALSIILPAEPTPAAIDAISNHAESRGVRIADHALRDAPLLPAPSPLGQGIDPAAHLLAGKDPLAAITRSGALLHSARLSDSSVVTRTEIAAPGSRLDLLSYAATLGVAGYTRDLVVDLRGLRDQAGAAQRAHSHWAALHSHWAALPL
jgi:sugar phosphate isomerase/epimerase